MNTWARRSGPEHQLAMPLEEAVRQQHALGLSAGDGLAVDAFRRKPACPTRLDQFGQRGHSGLEQAGVEGDEAAAAALDVEGGPAAGKDDPSSADPRKLSNCEK